VETQTAIEIRRPSEEVFAYVADMSNNPHWQRGQERCTWTSEPPHGLGATYDQEAKFLGKKIVSSFEVVEFEPGRRIRIKTTGGTMPIDVTREVTGLSDISCEVLATVRGEPPRVFRLLGPLMNRIVTSNIRKDYTRLKALLEASN
jgi:uncharacterized membrane protein